MSSQSGNMDNPSRPARSANLFVFIPALFLFLVVLTIQGLSLGSSDPLAAYVILMLSVYFALGVWAARRNESASRAEADNLVVIFIIGFAARLVWAFSSCASSSEAAFPDAVGYLKAGRHIANYWAQNMKIDYLYLNLRYDLQFGFVLYNGLHAFFHPSRLLPMISDCFLGAYMVILVHRIAGYFYAGPRNTRIRLSAAVFMAFFPSALFYSATNLKESVCAFLFIYAAALLIGLSRGISFFSLVKMALCLVAMSTIRFYYVFFFFLAGILVILTASTGKKNALVLKLVMIFLVVASIYSLPPLRGVFQRYFNVGAVMYFTENMVEYSSAPVSTDVKISVGHALSPAVLMDIIPVGILRTFLSPLPTKVSPEIAALQPGMYIYYLFLPYVLYGFFRFTRLHFRGGIPVYALFIMCVLLNIISLGGEVRRNMNIWPLMAIFCAVGMGEFREFRRTVPTASLVVFLLYCFFCSYLYGRSHGIALIKPLLLIFGLYILWIVFVAIRKIPLISHPRLSDAET